MWEREYIAVNPPPLHPGSKGYPYTGDLITFDYCIRQLKAASAMLGITIPLNIEAWESMLACHSDRWYTQYIIDGLSGGFRIGANRGRLIRSATSNIHVPSALQY